jgi:hypothetical protein
MIVNTSKFWIVTRPTRESRLDDICFESDITGLTNQINGGLIGKDIIAIFFDEDARKEAQNNARLLLGVLREAL